MHDEQYVTRHIPENFESGINAFGMSFRARFIVEGGLLGLLFGGISYFYLVSVNAFDIGTRIGISIALDALFMILGLKGINDEPISEFLMHLVAFSKGKNTAYYNPRIKTEAKPLAVDDMSELPKEKLLSLAVKVKDELKEKAQLRAQNRTENEKPDEIIVFEDDLKLKERKHAKKRERN